MGVNDFDNDLPDLTDLDDEQVMQLVSNNEALSQLLLDEEDDEENDSPDDDEEFGTYQDPDFDPDNDDEEENEYSFLEDPDEIANLSMGEVEDYAQEIDPSELNEDQEDGYQMLMERDAQIKQDKVSLIRFKIDILKEMSRIRQLKAQYPEAKKRLPQLKVEQKKSPKQMQAKLKSYGIQEEEILAAASKEIKKVKTLIKAEIAVATAQLAAEVAKDIATKIPFPANVIVLGVILTIIQMVFTIAIVCMAILVIAIAVNQNVDVENGQFATAAGISGDKFYGARYIYYDDEKAVQELESNYQNLVVDLVTRIDEINGIDATIQLTWTGDRPAELTQMIKVVADQTDNSDEVFDNLYDHLEIVDHFGYTGTELDNIQSALLEYIKVNNIFAIDEEVFTSNFDDIYNTIFDTNYSSLNVVAPLYFVQDVILESDKSMLETMPEKNYVAMIFMPKEEVTIEEINFMLYVKEKSVDENAATQVKIEFVSNNSNNETILASDIADSSWWDVDQSAKETKVVTNITLSQFASIDLANQQLLNGASIYSLIESDLQINSTKIAQLFSSVEVSGNNQNYIEINYLPSTDQNCYYLRFEADGVFQFCEYYTKY